MLDELEQQRLTLTGRLTALLASSQPCHYVASPQRAILTSAIAAVGNMLSTRENPGDETWISIVRQMVQKVVIEPSRNGNSARLTIHSRLAAILAGHLPRFARPAISGIRSQAGRGRIQVFGGKGKISSSAARQFLPNGRKNDGIKFAVPTVQVSGGKEDGVAAAVQKARAVQNAAVDGNTQ